ncbi:MAG TPA: DUF1549 domain-containing protein, partial [Pirellulales bacterium]|nr:DUF1549 domain-containing protein [Pirellulales bacterium]
MMRILLIAVTIAGASVCAAEPVDFAHDIAPIIKRRCASCHTDGTYKGSLSLDTRKAMLESEAVVPGHAKQSDLLERITSDDPDTRMPPKGKRLLAREVAIVKRWIDEGAAWPEELTFKKDEYIAPLRPRNVELPPARPGCEHPIDRILAEYFRKQNVEPTEPLDDVAFIRRAYLDIVGLLPPIEELTRFLDSRETDKRNRLVDRLLEDDTAYADHWLSFWNDLLRNDYRGTGFTDGGRVQITAWLYQSLLANKPYDQFVRELISPTEASKGFVYGIKWRGRVNASQVREIQFSQNVSQVFFGINMKCASCHDSFIDRWKLDDAYALAAVVADEPLEIHRCDKATGRTAVAGFLWPELGSIDSSVSKETRLEQLAALVTHPENGRFQRTIVNRIWQRLMGRGIVHPVDVMAGRPWSDELLDYLANYLVANDYDLKRLIAHIVESRAYQSQVAAEDDDAPGGDFVFRGPTVKRMTAEEFVDAVWAITDTRPTKLVAPIYPGMPQSPQKKKPPDAKETEADKARKDQKKAAAKMEADREEPLRA